MKILIAGVARSGTSTLFQVLGRAALRVSPGCECWYEPDLWHIWEALKTAVVENAWFNNENVDPFSLYVHTATPLFLATSTRLFDEWIDRVFAASDAADERTPSRVVKIIRGMGRLKPILERVPDLKIVVVARNPLDTVNSSLGLFSFFGEETHPSDRPRFRDELQARERGPERWPGDSDMVGWSELWVSAMLRAALETAAEHPDRVTVFPYEAYTADKRGELAKLYAFLGLGEPGPEADDVDEPTGVTTKRRNIDDEAAQGLLGSVEAYEALLRAHGFAAHLPAGFAKDIYRRFIATPAEPNPLLSDHLSRTAIQWRAKAMAQADRVTELKRKLAAAGAGRASADTEGRPSVTRRGPAAHAGQDLAVGCIVTTYNNERTIAAALESVLAQSRPYSEIVVCDDCSSDGTVDRASALLADVPGARIERRQCNIGPSANRDLGIRGLNSPLFTQLDGDDRFFPTKNEAELAALRDPENDVAFSNIELLTKNRRVIQDTSPLDGHGHVDAFEMIATRSSPVPRDMLMSRELYLSAGGYEYAISRYEDWGLKLRLCLAMGGSWRHAKGDVGTIYDRREAGLSKGPAIGHVYWQLRALGGAADGTDVGNEVLASSCRKILTPLKGKWRGLADSVIDGDLSNAQLRRLRTGLRSMGKDRHIFADDEPLYKLVWDFLDVIVNAR